MTLNAIFSDRYLTSRAIKAVEDSLKELNEKEREEFAADALRTFEPLNAPLPFLDALYLTAYH